MKGSDANNQPVGFFHGWFEFHAALAAPTRLILMVLIWTIFLSLWQFFPRPETLQELIPTFTEVVWRMQQMFSENGFLSDIMASLKRIGLSFAIAAGIALPLGILMGVFPFVEGLLNPLVSPLRYLPAPSFIPFLLALMGTGDEQKIALLVIGVVWFLISLLMDDTKRVPKELVEISRTLGANRLQVIRSVVVPAALPSFVDTMRQMLAVSWTYLVIAEIVASTDGIGAVMMRARRLVSMDTILACILTIGILGLLSDSLIRAIHRVAFPYLQKT